MVGLSCLEKRPSAHLLASSFLYALKIFQNSLRRELYDSTPLTNGRKLFIVLRSGDTIPRHCRLQRSINRNSSLVFSFKTFWILKTVFFISETSIIHNGRTRTVRYFVISDSYSLDAFFIFCFIAAKAFAFRAVYFFFASLSARASLIELSRLRRVLR